MATRIPQLIRVNDEQVVLKHGVQELLVSGREAADVATQLIAELQQVEDLDGFVPNVPDELRPTADQLLRTMRSRRLIAETAIADPASGPTDHAFSEAFGAALEADPAAMRDRLESSAVTVVGINRTARYLVGALLRTGVGAVHALGHPVLDNHDLDQRFGLKAAPGAAADAEIDGWIAAGRLDHRSGLPATLPTADLAVACSDFGPLEALPAINRATIAAEQPFLPIWLAERQGFIGPLGVPHETGCLRCWLDATAAPLAAPGRITVSRPEAATADHASGDHSIVITTAAAVCANVAAMEVIKFLTGCAPSAVVGRSVRVDTESLALDGRRVWKRPRCPDCSEIARHRIPSVLKGPQIPNR